MAFHFQEVAGAQGGLIAFAGSQAVVAAVALEATAGELLAALAVAEAAGVVVVFQVWQLLAADVAFQQQAGLVVVVVAACDAAGAGFKPDRKALDDRVVGDHAVALIKTSRRQARKAGLVVTKASPSISASSSILS